MMTHRRLEPAIPRLSAPTLRVLVRSVPLLHSPPAVARVAQNAPLFWQRAAPAPTSTSKAAEPPSRGRRVGRRLQAVNSLQIHLHQQQQQQQQRRPQHSFVFSGPRVITYGSDSSGSTSHVTCTCIGAASLPVDVETTMKNMGKSQKPHKNFKVQPHESE